MGHFNPRNSRVFIGFKMSYVNKKVVKIKNGFSIVLNNFFKTTKWISYKLFLHKLLKKLKLFDQGSVSL
jgi:hypothetical protein